MGTSMLISESFRPEWLALVNMPVTSWHITEGCCHYLEVQLCHYWQYVVNFKTQRQSCWVRWRKGTCIPTGGILCKCLAVMKLAYMIGLIWCQWPLLYQKCWVKQQQMSAIAIWTWNDSSWKNIEIQHLLRCTILIADFRYCLMWIGHQSSMA